MFEGAKLKVERANQHVSDLQGQFEKFVASNPHSISIKTNTDTGQAAVRVRFNREMPAEFALIIGDAIHNMRCALDHMTWELIGRDGGTQNRYLSFPTGDNRTSFEARCDGIETPSLKVRDLLKEREAFPGGRGDALYVISQLDNADKHTVITPVIRASRISRFKIVSRDGSTMEFIDNAVGGGSGPYGTLATIPPGGSVELDNDARATPEIFFGNGIVAGREVFSQLHQFIFITRSAIGLIEKAIP